MSGTVGGGLSLATEGTARWGRRDGRRERADPSGQEPAGVDEGEVRGDVQRVPEVWGYSIFPAPSDSRQSLDTPILRCRIPYRRSAMRIHIVLMLSLLLPLAACDGNGGGGSGEPFCEPETMKCIGNAVVRCNSAGSGWEFWKECGDGESCLDGECVSVAQPDAVADVGADANPDVFGDVLSELPLSETFIDVHGDTPDTLDEVQTDGSSVDICIGPGSSDR